MMLNNTETLQNRIDLQLFNVTLQNKETTDMNKRKRCNWLELALSCTFTVGMIGAIYIAPTYKNELQVLVTILVVATIVLTFAVISRNVKILLKNKLK